MLFALLLALAAHPNSISSALISEHAPWPGQDPGDARFDVELRFEARTANELLRLDLDGDGRLGGEELAAARAPLGAYLGEHFQLLLGGPSPATGRALTPTVTALDIDWSSSAGGGPQPELTSTWLVAHLALADPAPSSAAESLWVACSLFQETSPDHRNFARFAGPPAVDWIFSAADPVWHFGLSAPARAAAPTHAFWPWVQLGFEHILDGPDHLCFVLGLLLAAGGLRQLGWTITGFTLSHSVTLSLAAFGLVPIRGMWVEVLIAASIVYVGEANLRAGGPRRAWPEAFGFGLVHGLGFAGALGDALGTVSPGTVRLLPLLGFNLGIELGQLVAASLFLLVLWLLGRAGLKRPLLVRIGSRGVVVAGLIWLGLRLFA